MLQAAAAKAIVLNMYNHFPNKKDDGRIPAHAAEISINALGQGRPDVWSTDDLCDAYPLINPILSSFKIT
jgi:hypothetical protein